MQDRIWITRTVPSAHKSAANFAHLGLACAISPLLKITPTPHMPSRPDKGDLLVFTSVNGLNWFCEFTPRRDWAVVTVGDETAARARVEGFTDVYSAGGTSRDVTDLIKSKFKTSQAVIHCAGKEVRGSITQDLKAVGFSARRDIYYETHSVTSLPKIDISKLSYIALYSPLAARTLASLKPNLSSVITLSISRATDSALGQIKCQSRLIAKAPNETAMLALLGRTQAV